MRVRELDYPCVFGPKKGDGFMQPDNAARAALTVCSALLGFLFAGFW
jgi:hypothetical protein